MADEQKPKVEFFIPPADATPEQSGPAAAPAVPPLHFMGASPEALRLQSNSIVEQAQQLQLAEQQRLEQLRQVQFQVDLRHRRSQNDLVTSNMKAAAGGVVLGLLLWWVNR